MVLQSVIDRIGKIVKCIGSELRLPFPGNFEFTDEDQFLPHFTTGTRTIDGEVVHIG